MVNEPVPGCIISKDKHLGHRIAVCVTSAFLFGMMCFVFVSQNSSERWVTRVIQFKVETSPGVAPYSGCYEISPVSKHNNRYAYNLLGDIGDTPTRIRYCKNDRKWYLYNNPEYYDATDDPWWCARKSIELAHSAKTDSFDIGTTFEEPWYSASNEPLDLIFFELGENQDRCVSACKCNFLVYGNRMEQKHVFF